MMPSCLRARFDGKANSQCDCCMIIEGFLHLHLALEETSASMSPLQNSCDKGASVVWETK